MAYGLKASSCDPLKGRFWGKWGPEMKLTQTSKSSALFFLEKKKRERLRKRGGGGLSPLNILRGGWSIQASPPKKKNPVSL